MSSNCRTTVCLIVLCWLSPACSANNALEPRPSTLLAEIERHGSDFVWEDLKAKSNYFSGTEEEIEATPLAYVYDQVASGDPRWLAVAEQFGQREGLFGLGLTCSVSEALPIAPNKVLQIISPENKARFDITDVCHGCMAGTADDRIEKIKAIRATIRRIEDPQLRKSRDLCLAQIDEAIANKQIPWH